MDWRFTPPAAPLLVAAALLLVIAGVAIARRRVRGTRAIALTSFAIGVYVVGYLLELGSLRLSAVARCLAIEYLGIANVPPLLLVLVLAYTGRGRVFHPLALAALFILPAVTCVLAFTNASHELIWRDLRIDTSGAFTRTLFERGPWYWIHNAYVYLIIVASIALLARERLRATGVFRRQATVMLFGLLVPVVVHLVYLSRPVRSGLDPNPYALLVTAFAFAWGMFAYGLWDIVPVAREAVLASLRAAVIVVDRSGRVADLNPAACRLLGASAEQALGRPLPEALPAAAALAAADPPKELAIERDGETLQLDVSVTPLTDEGRIEGRLYLLRDATTERRAEAALTESEARFRSLLETAPDAIVISDPEGRIALVNRQAEVLFGYGPGELLDRRIEELVPAGRRDGHTAHRARYLSDPSVRPMGRSLDLTARRKDGSELPVEISLSPVATASGLLITSIVRDLTSRKRVEEQLRLQGVALESAANAIVITDRVGRILWVNPAFTRLTGYSSSEALGQTPRLLKSGAHTEEFYRELWETILAGRVWHGETVNRRKDGRFFTEEQTIAPVRDEAGVVSHFIAIKQDVSERKLAEVQRAGMTRTMVHDLRSPLTAMQGAVKLALQSASIPEKPRAFLETGLRNGERMLDLLGAILELSRLQSGQATLERTRVAPADLVEEALRLIAPRAVAKDQRLESDLSPDLPELDADRRLLGRVLQNLLDNALKFTPAGGRIGVSGRAEGTDVVLCISDDGPGVPAELRDRLFREFVTGTLEGRGTGIGLAFCRQAVEAHGGRIWLERGAPGTAVAFSLPAA